MNETEIVAVTRLRKVVDKFQREKEVKYLNRDWKIRREQSSKRRIAVEALRTQVYARMWELYHPVRVDEDLYEHRSVFDKRMRVKSLTIKLDKLRINVKATGAGANDLRSTLHGHVEEWLKGEGKEIRKNAPDKAMKDAWDKYYKESGDPADIIRLGTVDLADLLADRCTYLKYPIWTGWTGMEKGALGKMMIPVDEVVGPKTVPHPPVEKFPVDPRRELEAYLRELLSVEMADEVAFVNEALNGEDDHRAVVHLDYYAFRDLANIGLHKDTVGNTLFVALHYMNDEEMMGPEYIDDPVPVRPKDGTGYYPDTVYTKNAGDRERFGAPWAKAREVRNHPTIYVWPQELLAALQDARKPPGEAGYIQNFSKLPPNGLITFVDELVFHATPSMMVRKSLDTSDDTTVRDTKRRHLSSGVSIAGAGGFPSAKLNLFGERTFQTRIQRRLSLALNNEDLPDSKSKDGVRRFWRVWLSIVPKHWYEELRIP